jgi:hypothetical protein
LQITASPSAVIVPAVQRLDDAWDALGPVEPVSGEHPDPIALAPADEPIPVVLDFVDPTRPTGNRTGSASAGKGSNEPFAEAISRPTTTADIREIMAIASLTTVVVSELKCSLGRTGPRNRPSKAPPKTAPRPIDGSRYLRDLPDYSEQI